MARRKMINKIRTDTIENRIAIALARKQYIVADTWRQVAVDATAPICEKAIEHKRLAFAKVVAGWEG